ncbi:MAG: Gfo/Idh/MocA family protein [Gaiellaceae bacterium]
MTATGPLEVGIVGAGNVLPAYLQVLDRLVARGLAREGLVCARRRETWDSLHARRPGLSLVDDASAVVESEATIVVVLTPPESHAELVRLALEHGKHVVAEKPLALSRAAAEPLFELAAQKGLHLLAAPFTQLAPTFRALWGELRSGAVGRIHSARGLYGNAGSHWASWYHAGGVGPLAEAGIYNLKSLTAILGPVVEVLSAEATAVDEREAAGTTIKNPDPDVSHVLLRHEEGALSSVVSSQAIQRYRRPGLELYGTEGTANLLGDDWDPRGFEIWRNEEGRWEEYEAIDPTWLWADGLREAVLAVREDRPPLADPMHDLHVLEIVDAARQAAVDGLAVAVSSRFGPLDLRPEEAAGRSDRQHLHDHTRPPDEQ